MERFIQNLRTRRALLLKAYIFHVAWFSSTCAFAITNGTTVAFTTSFWLALLSVPPVLLYTVSVHKACRAIDPNSKTVGWKPVIIATLLLTPFESGLILPARNLWISRRILQKWGVSNKATAAQISDNSENPHPH
jgi:hypothetical protein